MKTLRPRLASAPTQRGWQPDSRRGNRHQRGYGSTWSKTRVRILERDNGLCQVHLNQGEVQVGTQVDHIVSKAEARWKGWTTTEIEADSNLQTICEACHLAKTSGESRKGGG